MEEVCYVMSSQGEKIGLRSSNILQWERIDGGGGGYNEQLERRGGLGGMEIGRSRMVLCGRFRGQDIQRDGILYC